MRKAAIHLSLLLSVPLFTISCKKAIDTAVNNAATATLNSSSYAVTKFTEGGTDITAIFSGWLTKFGSDGTLVSTKGTTTVNGTWSTTNILQNVTCQYAASAPDPLPKLNGTWAVVDQNATVQNLSQTKNNIAYTLQLTKQ